jgi:uncharacterized membrane protein YbhN (UPF0104 family)
MFPSLAHQLAAFGLFGADVVVRAARIRLLVPGTPNLTLRQAITINAYGDAASAITPARLGGDPARFLGFRRAGVETPRALAGLAVEALIDWVLLALAAVLLGVAFADTAAAGVARLVALATGPTARVLIAAVLALALVSAALALWYRRRHPLPLPGGSASRAASLAATWRHARGLGGRTVMLAAALTTLSMAARTAILPVLAAGLPGLDPRAVILGSFALLYGQLALPTPAGAGAVELGFVGGFAESMSPRALAALLLAWRLYTLILGAALGGVLAATTALGAWLRRRRSGATSSVNVRSQP